MNLKLSRIFGKILLLESFKRIGVRDFNLSQISLTKYGRPYINSNAHEVDFNISHSGEFVVCAITKNFNLGVDIEEMVPVDFSDFSHILTPEEMNDVQKAEYPLHKLYSYWTGKESVAKADGRGVSIMKDLSINQGTAHINGCQWYLKELDIHSCYSSFLATTDNTLQVSVEYIDIVY